MDILQDISYLAAFLVLVVVSGLRVAGDVALHSHVRALLYEAEQAEEKNVCYQLEQANEESDAPHAAITDGASEPTIRSIPDQVSEEPDASKSSVDSDSKPTKERESKCIQALTSYVPDHESLNAQTRQHFVELMLPA